MKKKHTHTRCGEGPIFDVLIYLVLKTRVVWCSGGVTKEARTHGRHLRARDIGMCIGSILRNQRTNGGVESKNGGRGGMNAERGKIRTWYRLDYTIETNRSHIRTV